MATPLKSETVKMDPPHRRDLPISRTLKGILLDIREIGTLERTFEAQNEELLSRLKDRNQLYVDNVRNLTNQYTPNPNPENPPINNKFTISAKIYELHIRNGTDHTIPFIYNGDLSAPIGSEVTLFYTKERCKMDGGMQIATNRSIVLSCADKSYGTKLLLTKDAYKIR